MDLAGWINKNMLSHYSHIRMQAKRQSIKALALNLEGLGMDAKLEVLNEKKTA